MKIRSLFAILALSLFALSSCDNSPVYDLDITPREIFLTKDGGKETVTVTANASWKVLIPDDSKSWITVTPEESEAPNGTFEISVVSTITEINKRVGSVHVVNGDNVQEVSVTQYGTTVPQAKILGKWKMTECDSQGMVNSEFTFNSDKSCVANVAISPAGDVDGTYTIDGNIIHITIPMRQPLPPMLIDIIVESLDTEENTIEAIAIIKASNMSFGATIEKQVQ